jgi:HEAT repeat protein
LKPINGQDYLMLLTRDTRETKSKGFQLVHGVGGARLLPEEGRQAFVEAVTRMAAIQGLHDDTRVWQELRRMLEDTNPLLLETALTQYEKFRRAGPDELPMLQPLLDHPRAEVRAAAARVIGGVAGGGQPIPPELASELVGELTARARRDDVIAVRVAATSALAGFRSASVSELLHAIALDDPDQVVRLEAQKVLYERGAAEPPAPRPN